MDIRILPSNIANMIAAGEVVQRPSSVVKELMENAVDAGADSIDVVVTDSGRTLVQVIDNGCGMSPDEAVLCFERHATSKIATADDLEAITTFGFRGEALASIAAVAEVTLKTRREEDQTGCQVEFADSKHLATVETAAPKGTNIAVRNLFYNVPARRKFLKSDKVELKHIIEEFTRIALTRPGIAFSLRHNGNELYVLKKAKSLKYRISDIFGKNVSDRIVDISADTTVMKVSGFVCRPDLARKSVGEQFFFVNGRYFRSPYLNKAVSKAYEDMIPDGAIPSYFIFIDTDPRSVDVNIHPTKAEVKFEDEPVVFNVLYACVREALGSNSFGATIDFDTAGVPEMPVFGSNYSSYRPQVEQPSAGSDSFYNPFDSMPGGSSYTPRSEESGFGPGEWNRHVSKTEDYGKLFEDRSLPSSSAIVLQGRYIATPVASGLLLVHIRRARERILYERMLETLNQGGHASQAALFPVRIEVGAANRLIYEAHMEQLQQLGFDIKPDGEGAIEVRGVPESFSCDPARVEALMADVLIALSEDGTPLAGMMDTALAGKLASAGAAAGRTPSTTMEAQRLVDTLFGCSNSEFTPRGHKIMTIIPSGDIDKLF